MTRITLEVNIASGKKSILRELHHLSFTKFHTQLQSTTCHVSTEGEQAPV